MSNRQDGLARGTPFHPQCSNCIQQRSAPNAELHANYIRISCLAVSAQNLSTIGGVWHNYQLNNRVLSCNCSHVCKLENKMEQKRQLSRTPLSGSYAQPPWILITLFHKIWLGVGIAQLFLSGSISWRLLWSCPLLSFSCDGCSDATFVVAPPLESDYALASLGE